MCKNSKDPKDIKSIYDVDQPDMAFMKEPMMHLVAALAPRFNFDDCETREHFKAVADHVVMIAGELFFSLNDYVSKRQYSMRKKNYNRLTGRDWDEDRKAYSSSKAKTAVDTDDIPY